MSWSFRYDGHICDRTLCRGCCSGGIIVANLRDDNQLHRRSRLRVSALLLLLDGLGFGVGYERVLSRNQSPSLPQKVRRGSLESYLQFESQYNDNSIGVM